MMLVYLSMPHELLYMFRDGATYYTRFLSFAARSKPDIGVDDFVSGNSMRNYHEK